MHALAEAARFRPARKPRRHQRARHALAAMADEKRLFPVVRNLRAYREPFLKRGARLRADRHGARLRAFAGDGDFSVCEIEPSIADIERDELAHAKTGRIKKLEHRLVANEGSAFTRRPVEQA